MYTAKNKVELEKKEMEIDNLVKASELLQEARILIETMDETMKTKSIILSSRQPIIITILIGVILVLIILIIIQRNKFML